MERQEIERLVDEFVERDNERWFRVFELARVALQPERASE